MESGACIYNGLRELTCRDGCDEGCEVGFGSKANAHLTHSMPMNKAMTASHLRSSWRLVRIFFFSCFTPRKSSRFYDYNIISSGLEGTDHAEGSVS